MASDAAQTPYEQAQRLVAGGNTREAVAPLRRAVTEAPSLGAAWRLLADIHLIGGDFEAAQDGYARMLSAVVPDQRLRGPADALADGDTEGAESAVRALLAVEPANLPAAHLMAEVLA